MRAYSPDLRRKIVNAVERGLTKTDVGPVTAKYPDAVVKPPPRLARHRLGRP